MTRFVLCALAFSCLLAGSASADIVYPGPPTPPALHFMGATVTATASDAPPAAEVQRIDRELNRQFHAANARMQRCVSNADLREDPLRSRARRLEIWLSFTRSPRPTRVWVASNVGFPSYAERCALEAASSILLRPAPQGGLLVRASFTIG